jgi:hypothetical protein
MIGLNDVTNGSRPVCENLDDEARIFITFRFRTLSPILNFAVMRHVYQRLRGAASARQGHRISN